MITVRIDEEGLLDLLVDRIKFWTNDPVKEKLFKDYYRGLVYSGCFEGCDLDIIDTIVDNDYVNNLTIISKEYFERWGIEGELDDRIVAFNEEEDLYLIRIH